MTYVVWGTVIGGILKMVKKVGGKLRPPPAESSSSPSRSALARAANPLQAVIPWSRTKVKVSLSRLSPFRCPLHLELLWKILLIAPRMSNYCNVSAECQTVINQINSVSQPCCGIFLTIYATHNIGEENKKAKINNS